VRNLIGQFVIASARCYQVKARRMKDGAVLRALDKHVQRERYTTSLNAYRAQELLKWRLDNLTSLSKLELARAAGDERLKAVF